MKLEIDGKRIRTNAFVQKFLSNIIWSLIDSLDDIPENPQAVAISLVVDSDAALSVEGQDIRMNPFVQRVTRNIITGLVNALDEIPENPHDIVLSISKK